MARDSRFHESQEASARSDLGGRRPGHRGWSCPRQERAESGVRGLPLGKVWGTRSQAPWNRGSGHMSFGSRKMETVFASAGPRCLAPLALRGDGDAGGLLEMLSPGPHEGPTFPLQWAGGPGGCRAPTAPLTWSGECPRLTRGPRGAGHEEHQSVSRRGRHEAETGPWTGLWPSRETWSKAPAPRGSRPWAPRLLRAELRHLEAKAAEAPA